MAFPTVSKAVATVVMESKLKTVDDLVVFLDSKIEVDNDLKKMFHDFKNILKDAEEKVVKAAGKTSKKVVSSDGTKKKRQPSVFNLYIKDVMPNMKDKHPDWENGKQLIAFASQSWKTDPMATFIKGKVDEMKKEDKNADVVDLYAKAKALYMS